MRNTTFTTFKKTSYLVLITLFAISCSKDPGIKTPPSTAKGLESFGFYKADNPTLSADCQAVMIGQNAYVTLPLGTDLSLLTARFSTSPKSILTQAGRTMESKKTALNYTNLVEIKVIAEDASSNTLHINVRQGIPSIDAKVYALMKKHSIPGVTISVAYKERLVYAQGYGYANSSTRERVEPNYMFRLASGSKTFTSMCIQRLVDDGRLSLSHKPFSVGGVLQQDFPSIKSGNEDVTIKMLLEHNTGWDSATDHVFSGATSSMTASQTVAYALERLNFTNAPGTKYAYSNLGFSILGRVIEKITGKSFEEYLKEAVLTPAGTTNIRLGSTGLANRFPNETVYYSQEGTNGYGNNTKRIDAAGGLIASTPDLMRILTRIDGKSAVADIFPKTTLERMFTASATSNTYALGWRVNHSLFRGAHHGGNLAGTATLTIKGDEDVHCAILCNSRSYIGGLDNELYDVLLNIINSQKTIWPEGDLFTKY